MKAKFKTAIAMIAFWCSLGVFAQSYVKVDAAGLGLNVDEAVALAAGTELGRTESFIMRTAFDDTYKLQDVKANDCDLWVFDGTEITTDNGFMGQTNPKDAGGSNPATTTPPTAPVSGAVIEIEALKDGYVYVWGKLSSHKNYMVSENNQPMGYQLVMQTATLGKLDITVKGSDEYNYVYEPIAWPEVIFTGNPESAVKENGMGVIKFAVFTGCKYFVNATASKIIVGGAWFDLEGDVEVVIANTSDTTSHVLMSGEGSIDEELTLQELHAQLLQAKEVLDDKMLVLDSLGLIRIKDELMAEYIKVDSISETPNDSIYIKTLMLRNLINYSLESIEAYNNLGKYITECDSLVAQRASESFSNSIDAAKSIYNNAETALSEDFEAAYKSLAIAHNLYRIENISTVSFNFSSTATVGNWHLYLDKTNNVARVNRYNGNETDVIIPETFTYNGVEYITVGLGNYDNSTWQYNYYYDNYHLKSVTLPATLRFLGSYAFYCCRGLTEIHIPSNVESIGDYAFSSCNALESITIPASVTSIGYEPFSSCSKLKTLRSEATVPPVCSYSNDNIRVVYVPVGSGAAYEAVDYWQNRIIVDGEGISASVDVETPGTLGEKLLGQVEYLSQVNYLTVSGALNDDDIYNIQHRLTDLLTIDMSGVKMATLPDYMFADRYGLQQVVLPDSLTSIGNRAFYECYSLKNIIIPKGVTSIGAYAFYGCEALQTIELSSAVSVINEGTFHRSGIESVKISEGVASIGTHAFSETKLKTLECPSTLISIKDYAFSDCASLSSIKLNEGLQSLEYRAFYNCDALTEIVLPSTLSYCYAPFNDCNNIGTVTCLALLPPTLENSYSIFYKNNVSRVLYVPEWTVNNYKLTVGWDDFSYIEPIKAYYPEYISINDKATLTLPDSVPNAYKPNLKIGYLNDLYNYMYSIDRYGSLILNGNGMLSVGEFQMVYNSYSTYANQRFYSTTPMTSDCSLVNNVMLRADSVEIISYHPSDVWTFLSLPYDVKVSDIVSLPENSNFVIRKYSGQDRADANLNNTWQDMTTDSILRAGEGYIWQSNNGYEDYYSYWSGSAYYNEFHIPAMNNTNKNQIFANNDRTITLHEYLSEFSHNRSWNLIGNPYPSYYDARAMEFTAPFTVWDMYNKCYQAYSPIDDEYIFSPGEAFFVQRPVDAESITFAADGRQTDRVERDRSAQAKAYTRSADMRQVFNLTLSDGEMTDRTRFVINPAAACDYEMATDANKFMSSDTRAAQLYTIEGDVKFAINERPMSNGVITLGAYFGSKGSHTIALDTKVEGISVILVDKVAGTETDLMEGAYTFTAEAGVADDRFEVRMRADEENGDTTGMDSLSGKVSVKATAGQIVVTAPCESAIEIYNAEGQRIATATAASATFEVAQGVYVVKVQDTVHKVSVTQ